MFLTRDFDRKRYYVLITPVAIVLNIENMNRLLEAASKSPSLSMGMTPLLRLLYTMFLNVTLVDVIFFLQLTHTKV